MRSSLVSALAAVSLIAAPTASLAAAPGNAAALSIGGARAGAPVRDANDMSDTGYILTGLGVIAVIILIIVLIDDDDPSSP